MKSKTVVFIVFARMFRERVGRQNILTAYAKTKRTCIGEVANLFYRTSIDVSFIELTVLRSEISKQFI
jgi:hypothetical protein